jgi:hypothetical protein
VVYYSNNSSEIGTQLSPSPPPPPSTSNGMDINERSHSVQIAREEEYTSRED